MVFYSRMKNYELTLILKADLAESELQTLLGEIASVLQDAGALIISQDSKGKRSLIAPIQKHQEAELAVIRFTLDAQKIEDVEKELRAREDILRFMLLSYTPKKAQERTIAQPPTTTAAAAATAPTTPPAQEATEEEKVELGDIDKKLEEIFKGDVL